MNKERDKQRPQHEYSQAEINFPRKVEEVLETISPLSCIDSTNKIDQSVLIVKQLAYFVLFYDLNKSQEFQLWITNPNKIKDQSMPHWEVGKDLSLFLDKHNIDPKKYFKFFGGSFIVDDKNDHYLQFGSYQSEVLECKNYENGLKKLCAHYYLKAILSETTSIYENKKYKIDNNANRGHQITYQKNEYLLYGIARENNMINTEYLRFHLLATSAQQAPEIDASYFDDKTGKAKQIKAHIPANPEFIAQEIKQSSKK